MQQVKCAECGATADNDGLLEGKGWKYSFLAPELTRCSDCLRKKENREREDRDLSVNRMFRVFGPYTVLPALPAPEDHAEKFDACADSTPAESVYGLEYFMNLLSGRGWTFHQVIVTGVIELTGKVVRGPGGQRTVVPAACVLMSKQEGGNGIEQK